MRSQKKISILLTSLLATLAVSFLSTTPLLAQTETILHNFQQNNVDGFWPSSPLIFDASGNIYGTTGEGGAFADPYGTVFQMKPAGGGSWDEVVLHSFNNDGIDGWGAYSGAAFDASGNIFGATGYGGAYGVPGGIGGTVYELVRGPGGFTEKVIHSFGNGTDGNRPESKPVFDSAGNIYGTTLYGGTYGLGTVFELKPTPSGVWNEKILLNFNGTNGSTPSVLMFDGTGNLYGTAGGGAFGGGVTYELMPRSGGVWIQKILHNFRSDGTDGMSPGPLVFDTAGNLYGTTFYGGSLNEGTVYKLTPSGGSWPESILHVFTDGSGDCYWPDGDLLINASGSLYATCAYGGNYGYGTVFKFSPGPGGHWTEMLLHNFGSGTDGQIPTGGLTFDAAENIYGTTYSSSPYTCEGILGCGTVFEITP
jgi:uncharacterized repeat protein (TIGR03803 family)